MEILNKITNNEIYKELKNKENIEVDDVVIITGIGETFGIVRGHTILNVSGFEALDLNH